jgi:predicted transposase/invertase (TIGR01784 family)
MQFVNPQNDVAFKKIFGNDQHKEVLIGFLNAVLDLRGPKTIQQVQILNPYQAPKLEFLKYTLLDVKAIDQRGIHFIVEMQVENVSGIRKRFQYYVAKSYSGQLQRGNDYPRLNQVIFIGILNFVEFSNSHYLSRHLLMNCETQVQELQDLEFNFLELPKFTKKAHDLHTPLDKWAFFLKHASDLEVIPSHADTVALHTAYDIANRFQWTPQELEVYEYCGMKAQDERGRLELALQQERVAVVRRMLADGLSIEVVAKYMGLSIEQVKVLKSSSTNV